MNNLPNERVAFQTVVRKEIRRFMRIWVQTLVPPVINALLYLLIFGGLIGSRIREMDGIPYMDYIVPGIIMMGVITNSYGNVSSSFFAAKMQKYIEELLVSPVSNITIVAGFIIGGVARGLAVGLLVAIVSLLFIQIYPVHPLLTVLVMVLTSITFSLAGFINGVLAEKFDDISIVPNFILAPLTYLGGIFYSVSLLPPVWEAISRLNPVLYMINGFRYGILGTSDMPIWQSLGVILFSIMLLGYLAITLLNRGVGIKQ